jgi:hypothetical protein
MKIWKVTIYREDIARPDEKEYLVEASSDKEAGERVLAANGEPRFTVTGIEELDLSSNPLMIYYNNAWIEDYDE